MSTLPALLPLPALHVRPPLPASPALLALAVCLACLSCIAFLARPVCVASLACLACPPCLPRLPCLPCRPCVPFVPCLPCLACIACLACPRWTQAMPTCIHALLEHTVREVIQAQRQVKRVLPNLQIWCALHCSQSWSLSRLLGNAAGAIGETRPSAVAIHPVRPEAFAAQIGLPLAQAAALVTSCQLRHRRLQHPHQHPVLFRCIH